MPAVASASQTAAINAVYAAQAASSPPGPLIQLELDIAAAAATGAFELTGVTLTPALALVVRAQGYTTKNEGGTWTISWLKPAL